MSDLRPQFRHCEADWEYFTEDQIIVMDSDELFWLSNKTKLYYSVIRIDTGSRGLIFTVGLIKFYYKNDTT